MNKCKILDILFYSAEDCNAVYFAKFSKVSNVNIVVNVLF